MFELNMFDYTIYGKMKCEEHVFLNGTGDRANPRHIINLRKQND